MRRKPNILIILSDDHGYADVGFQGAATSRPRTSIRWRKSGVRFSNGYVSGPYCSPTRAGLLTGRYQQRFGHEFNPGADGLGERSACRFRETTLADRLKAAGYVTGLVGKWHLGSAPQFHPQRRGFDEFFGFLGGGHPYFPGQGAPIYRGNRGRQGREVPDGCLRPRSGVVRRAAQEGPVLALPGVQRGAHADARHRRSAAPVRVHHGRVAPDVCRDADRARRGGRQGARRAAIGGARSRTR